LPARCAKRRRLECIDTLGDAEQEFVSAGETLLSSGMKPSREVLEMCRRLMAADRATLTAQASVLLNIPCLPRFIVFLDPMTTCHLATAARRTFDTFQANTRELRAKLRSIISPAYVLTDVQRITRATMENEQDKHAPFVVEIVGGHVDNVKFMLELGIDPNGNVLQIEEIGGPACEECARALPVWRTWTFYDLAKVMATGSVPRGSHQQIERLMKEYGGISSKVLPSRRGLYQRFIEGSGYDSCDLCPYFDDSVRAERFTEDDERFNAAERSERFRAAVRRAQRRMRAKAEQPSIRFAQLRWSGAQLQH